MPRTLKINKLNSYAHTSRLRKCRGVCWHLYLVLLVWKSSLYLPRHLRRFYAIGGRQANKLRDSEKFPLPIFPFLILWCVKSVGYLTKLFLYFKRFKCSAVLKIVRMLHPAYRRPTDRLIQPNGRRQVSVRSQAAATQSIEPQF